MKRQKPDADAGRGATERLRVDKWLWHARFCKSRSIAAALASSGTLRINGDRVSKASSMVQPGDTLSFPSGPHIRLIRVLALGARRGPAAEAQTLYDDLDPPQPRPREPAPAARAEGSGRPTKRERRAVDRLRSPD